MVATLPAGAVPPGSGRPADYSPVKSCLKACQDADDDETGVARGTAALLHIRRIHPSLPK